MVMFKGKLPGKVVISQPAAEVIPQENKPVVETTVVKETKPEQAILKPTTTKFSVPPVKSEEEKLRARVKELELKLQILEHTSEGYSKNDREYIRKLEDIIKSEKAVTKAIMLQNVDLRMLCGKYAEHLPKIDVTEDNWQSKLKG